MSEAGLAKNIYNVGRTIIKAKDKETTELKQRVAELGAEKKRLTEALEGLKKEAECCGFTFCTKPLNDAIEIARQVLEETR